MLKKIAFYTLLVVLIGLLTGCATPPPGITPSTPEPANAPAAGTTNVIVGAPAEGQPIKVDSLVWSKPNEQAAMTNFEGQISYAQTSKTGAFKDMVAKFGKDQSLVVDASCIGFPNKEPNCGGFIMAVSGVAATNVMTLSIKDGAAQLVNTDHLQDLLDQNVFPKFCRGDYLPDNSGNFSYVPWALSQTSLPEGFTFKSLNDCPKDWSQDQWPGKGPQPKSVSAPSSSTPAKAQTPVAAKPAAKPVAHQPVNTGVGKSMDFTSGTPVLGYKIVIGDKVYMQCYLANPTSGGTLTDGVIWPTAQQAAELPACK